MTPQSHRLDRTISIQASLPTVFRFFTDSPRWASWWGAGSTIDPKPGGRVYIRHPGNVEVAGEILEIAPPSRIVFTYGNVSGSPIPPGGSTVTIQLEKQGVGTRLNVVHTFSDAAQRDHFVQGWRFQLALFSNVVADEVNAGAATKIDDWFRGWSEPDAAARERLFAGLAAADLQFRDRFSHLNGMSDLLPHIAAAQQFMPGMTIARNGNVRHCQGTVLADWTATGPDGQPRGRGTNVFVFDGEGKFASITGFWAM